MKQYSNGMKATGFTRKQISVVYSLAKQGKLKVEKWCMSDLYDLSDYYGYDFNKSIEYYETRILDILGAVFQNDLEKAQELIDRYTENSYSALSLKGRRKCNREYV